jgi:DNA-binding SARP family transcriptional activator
MFDSAIECYKKGLEIEPLAETFYFRIMKCHARAGRKAEALATYLKCERLFKSVLGVGPSSETEALVESLRKTD